MQLVLEARVNSCGPYHFGLRGGVARQQVAAGIPQWHWEMMCDQRRNDAYDRCAAMALSVFISPLRCTLATALLSRCYTTLSHGLVVRPLWLSLTLICCTTLSQRLVVRPLWLSLTLICYTTLSHGLVVRPLCLSLTLICYTTLSQRLVVRPLWLSLTLICYTTLSHRLVVLPLCLTTSRIILILIL